MERAERRPVPAILLGDAALALLRDIFGRPDLFADKPRIDRRIVAWGGEAPAILPHGGVVVSESELDAALAPVAENAPDIADFTVHSLPPFPAGNLCRFGERRAAAVPVDLAFAEDQSACWVESVEHGWLFLIPSEPGAGWRLAVGGAPETSLAVGGDPETSIAESRHIAPRIALAGAAGGRFETAPRMQSPLCGADWLACGTAAMAFDPICGDGTAQAVREAILAAAVITALSEGEAADALLGHYEAMLIASMRRHLRMCAAFYESGGQSDWWRAQLSSLGAGFAECTKRLATMPAPRFALHGLRLVPRAEAA